MSRPQLNSSKLRPPKDQHRLVYKTSSQCEEMDLKALIYFYNPDTVRSVRVDWREGPADPKAAKGVEWTYRLMVWTDEPLLDVLDRALVNMPRQYRARVLGWHRRHYKLRPLLEK